MIEIKAERRGRVKKHETAHDVGNKVDLLFSSCAFFGHGEETVCSTVYMCRSTYRKFVQRTFPDPIMLSVQSEPLCPPREAAPQGIRSLKHTGTSEPQRHRERERRVGQRLLFPPD